MLKFFNSWVLLTLALFYVGPIPWTSRGSWLVAVVVLAALIGLNLGAVAGRRLPALPQHRFPILGQNYAKWTVIVVFILLTQVHVKSLTDLSILNPFNYTLDFNAVYTQFQEILRDREFTAGSLESAMLLLKALMMPAVILVLVLSYPHDPKAIAFLLFPFIASSMMRGTDKETVDIAIYMIILAYYHKLLGRRALIFLCLVAIVVGLFMVRKLARFDGIVLHCLPITPEACFNFENALSRYISPSFEFLRIMLTNYLTQGYEGMARALEIPFEFNYGLGHMAPVQQKLCQIFDVSCGVQSFNDKLPDYGWDTRYKWSTSYTAIASDTHWLFVPLYMFMMGVLFGVSEKSWQQNRDYLSLACLLLVSIFVIYASANMQITGSLEWTIVYLTIFLWQICRIAVRTAEQAPEPRPLFSSVR